MTCDTTEVATHRLWTAGLDGHIKKAGILFWELHMNSKETSKLHPVFKNKSTSLISILEKSLDRKWLRLYISYMFWTIIVGWLYLMLKLV